MESIVYNQSGKKSGTITLPEKVFAVPFKGDLAHEVVTIMRGNARAGTAHTKDRSEVRGGGKKPWQQKGTGRARHGSRRSPLWRGGGTTFGPRKEKIFSRKINKKAKVKALFMLLSKKLKDNEILFVDTIALKEEKTKLAKEVLQNLSSVSGFENLPTKRKNSACVYIPQKDKKTERSFNNFGNIKLAPVTSMNPLDIATYKYIIITEPEKSIAFLAGKNKSKKVIG